MKKLFIITVLVLSLIIPSAAIAKTVTLKFAHTNSDKDLTHKSVIFFADKVKEYTGGAYKVELFPNAVLGNDVKLLELEAMGAVDFVISGPAIYAKHLKEMSVLLSPFLVETGEQGQHLYGESEIIKNWFKQLENKGFKRLATWERGFRCLNTKTPIKTPAEVKGVKLRVPPNPIHLTIWETLGATPVAMGIKEVYMAIQQGVIEGQENPPVTTFGLKMYEVAPNITMTNHVYGPLILSCSMKRWEKIKSKDQDAIMRAAKESIVYNNKNIEDNLDSVLQQMESKGTKIIRPDLNEWYQAVLPAYEKFKKIYGEDVVAKIMKDAEAVKAKYPRK